MGIDDGSIHFGAMSTLVSVDGEIVPAAAARVSVFDRGFLFGDSVYESFRTYRRVPFLLERHLVRLARSAQRLGIEIEGGLDVVRTEVARLIDALPDQETSFRVVVTRGAEDGVVDIDPNSAGRSTLVVIAREAKAFPADCYEKGIDLAVVSVVRNRRDMLDPMVKSGNYLNNLLAVAEAKSRGAFESVMLNADGFVTECSTSNLFIVTGGALVTPALECGLLDGVTRGRLLELAKAAAIPTREAKLRREDLLAADEVFLSSSFKEVMPVRTVDGTPTRIAVPGPVTARMAALYREEIEREIAARAAVGARR